MSVVRATSPVTRDFTRPLRMSSAVVPPTSGAKTSFDSPNVPWQAAHFASHTCWPFATLPEPGGNPLKSGRTSMSHAAISAGVAGRPTPGNCAATVIPAKARIQTRAKAALISLHIPHLAALGHLPRLDRVVVVDRARSAHRAQLVDLRLHIVGLVDGARLQDPFAALPHPVDVETREAFGKQWVFKPRRLPVAPAVEGHVDSLQPPAPRPCEAGDVVEALVEEALPARRRRDHRFAFLDRRVLAMAAIRHEVDGVPRFVLGAPGLVADLEAPQPLHPRDPLQSRRDEPQGVAVLGSEHLAVHRPRHHDVVERAFDCDRTREARAVGAF